MKKVVLKDVPSYKHVIFPESHNPIGDCVFKALQLDESGLPMEIGQVFVYDHNLKSFDTTFPAFHAFNTDEYETIVYDDLHKLTYNIQYCKFPIIKPIEDFDIRILDGTKFANKHCDIRYAIEDVIKYLNKVVGKKVDAVYVKNVFTLDYKNIPNEIETEDFIVEAEKFLEEQNILQY